MIEGKQKVKFSEVSSEELKKEEDKWNINGKTAKSVAEFSY